MASGSGPQAQTVTPAGFRSLALGLPEAHESAHHHHPDFRVGKRVFATLGYPDSTWAMVKLTPPQQARFTAEHPGIFVPVNGAWGARGATNVKMSSATRAALWPALVEAWKNIAPASIRARHEDPAA